MKMINADTEGGHLLAIFFRYSFKLADLDLKPVPFHFEGGVFPARIPLREYCKRGIVDSV